MDYRIETKAFVRSRGRSLKSKLGRFYASTLESKLARTFTDDVDISHGAVKGWRNRYRPGQRDDERSRKVGMTLYITI